MTLSFSLELFKFDVLSDIFHLINSSVVINLVVSLDFTSQTEDENIGKLDCQLSLLLCQSIFLGCLLLEASFQHVAFLGLLEDDSIKDVFLLGELLDSVFNFLVRDS